ncbi:unnamed protein product [Clavelina lepadiformis]|uniref:Uncharacterized protein n=1 Tax=Clavelina lepadiformis TaxID=159417 RepID=A0ABP0GVQ2_CLALP
MPSLDGDLLQLTDVRYEDSLQVVYEIKKYQVPETLQIIFKTPKVWVSGNAAFLQEKFSRYYDEEDNVVWDVLEFCHHGITMIVKRIRAFEETNIGVQHPESDVN